MLYFYVGLGLAMFTIVIQVFELSTTISKQSYINKTNDLNIEKILIKNENDKNFLKLLKDINGTQIGTGMEICTKIKNGINDESDPNYSILSKYSVLNSYNIGDYLYSSHPRLVDGCNFIKDSHRVLIVPVNTQGEYSLYSCIIDLKPACRFEFIN